MITNLRNINYMHHDHFRTIMMDDDDNILGESISAISGYNLHQVSLANKVCDISCMSYKYNKDGYMEPDSYGGHIIVKMLKWKITECLICLQQLQICILNANINWISAERNKYASEIWCAKI